MKATRETTPAIVTVVVPAVDTVTLEMSSEDAQALFTALAGVKADYSDRYADWRQRNPVVYRVNNALLPVVDSDKAYGI